MAADAGHNVDVHLTSEQWDDVVRRLTVLARALVPADQALRGRSEGPEDLVQQTILRLLDPATKVKWRREFGEPTVSKVVGFLAKVMKNYFLDQLKTGAYRHTASHRVLEDHVEDEDGAVRTGPVAIPSVEEQPVTRMYVEQLYARAREMAKTEDDIETVFYLDLQARNGGPYKNAEAAKELGLEATDIVNIRKRLNRLLVRARQGAPARWDREGE